MNELQTSSEKPDTSSPSAQQSNQAQYASLNNVTNKSDSSSQTPYNKLPDINSSLNVYKDIPAAKSNSNSSAYKDIPH